MKVKWLGHSAFLLTASDGTRLITDPYVPGSFDGAVGYGPINEACDGVTVSHDHADHNGYKQLPGSPKLIQGQGEFELGSIRIKGYSSYHDHHQGANRGSNTIFVYEMDGLKTCHAGDLGHILPEDTVQAIGKVDVLLVPVGGLYTIDAAEAHKVAEQLGAKVIIPMHFKTPKLGFDIAPVDGFIAGRPNVNKVGCPETEISPDKLPAEPEIRVLEHAF